MGEKTSGEEAGAGTVVPEEALPLPLPPGE
jgi:hypothetical protein